LTSHFQDDVTVHDVISRRKVLPPGEGTRPVPMQQHPPVLDLWYIRSLLVSFYYYNYYFSGSYIY